jgi:hypothetical protein
MNFLAIFLAAIALAHKQMRLVFQFFLSGITAYWLYKLQHPTVYLLDPNTYTLEQVQDWVSKGYAFKAMVYTAACYFFFYVVLRLVIINMINAPLDRFFKKLFSKLSQQEFRIWQAIMIKLLRKGVRWCVKKGIIKRDKNSEQVTYAALVDSIYSRFCICVHIILCWFILDINDFIATHILIAIVSLILLIQLVSVPLAAIFYKVLSKGIEHEATLIERELV